MPGAAAAGAEGGRERTMMGGHGSLLGLALLLHATVSYGRTDDLAVTLSAQQPWVYLGKFGFAVGNDSTVSQAKPAAPDQKPAISTSPFVDRGGRSCSATPARDGGRWGAVLEGGCGIAIRAATRASPREGGVMTLRGYCS